MLCSNEDQPRVNSQLSGEHEQCLNIVIDIDVFRPDL